MTHRCESGPRCRDRETQPDGKKLPAVTDKPMCDECIEHLRKRCVEAWTTDYTAIRIMLGERQAGTEEHVKYTPSPAIPLSTEPEKLMVDLQFYAELAAEMVSERLKLEWPPAEAKATAQPGFLERWNKHHPGQELATAEHLEAIGERLPRRRRPAQVIATAMQRVAPYLEELLECEPQPVAIWATGEAVELTPVAWRLDRPRRYVPVDGQGRDIIAKGRVLVELSGVDVATKLRDIHDLVRGYYGARGKDRADHMQLPCHKCGAKSLYRDHGSDLIRCTKCPPNSEGARGWTQDQYDRLAGLTRFHLRVQEEADMETLKWLVAEKEWENQVHAWLAAERWWVLGIVADMLGWPSAENVIAGARINA